MERTGIAFAGSIITDIVKTIDRFPEKGMLANISDISQSVGGCVPNTAIDLKTIDKTVPVSVYGCIGDDANGEFVINKLLESGIDVRGVKKIANAPTAFTDVMSLASGERTFFCASGANAVFSPENVDISGMNAKILHAGYILLLDAFDADDPEYGTVMARFLHDASAAGIETSIDAVSNENADYAKKIRPALPYCDYVIINEVECCRTWGLGFDESSIIKAMELTLNAGVRKKVIVHSKECGYLLDKSGKLSKVMSLDIPEEKIKGSVGAGDAFCAGALYSLYNGWDDTTLLEFASAAAACNLMSANSVDGMQDHEKIKDMQKYPRKTR